MKTVILAAGRGSRLGGLTENIPKCLVHICERSIIQRLLDALLGVPENTVCIVSGYRHDRLSHIECHQVTNYNWQKSEMVESLMLAKEFVGQDNVLVCYGDIIFDPVLLDTLIDLNNDCSVFYDINWRRTWERRYKNPLDDLETFWLSEKNEILGIGSRARSLDEIDGQFMGLVHFSAFGWECFVEYITLFEGDVKGAHFTKILNDLILRKWMNVCGVGFDGFWAEIDTVNDLAVAERELAKLGAFPILPKLGES